MVTAISILLRHDQAIYLVISFLVLSVAIKFATRSSAAPVKVGVPLLLWLTGAVGLLLPLIIYWQLQGALPEMWKQLIVFPLNTYARTSSLPFPKFNAQA